MFELSIDTEFCAAHAIMIAGEREPMHGHNWRVTVTIVGDALDGDGLLCDFHHVERLVAATVAPFRDQTLNEIAPFDRVNPTAEEVARHIALRVREGLPKGVDLSTVRVTEAPGCSAVYRHLPSPPTARAPVATRFE